jgi:hypothetical protein
VGRAVQRFTEAGQVLEQALAERPDDAETQFVLGRVRGLLALASIGYRLLEAFAERGLFTLDPIRDALSRGSDER